MLAEIIGYIAGILIAITMIPQIIISIKTKSVEGISMLMLIIFFTSMLLWTIYGIMINSYPLTITNGIATIVSGIQVYIKIKYKNK